MPSSPGRDASGRYRRASQPSSRGPNSDVTTAPVGILTLYTPALMVRTPVPGASSVDG